MAAVDHAPSTGAEGPALVLLALAFQEVGASLAVMVFPAAGPIGMAALRLCLSALVLWALVRPRTRGLPRSSWVAVTAYGLVLAAMNVFFYLSLEHLPLGTAVTLEILGPLTLSVILGRSRLSALWALIALGGVLLLGGNPQAGPDPLGVVFALTAGGLWAGYIMLTRRTGEHFVGLAGLTLGMSIGGLAVAPLALVTAGAALFAPTVLLAGLAIALLSSTIPYALEMRALRRMSPGSFAILLALAPAVAALAGLALLGQHLGVWGYLGIGLIVLAGIGATRPQSTPAAAR